MPLCLDSHGPVHREQVSRLEREISEDLLRDVFGPVQLHEGVKWSAEEGMEVEDDGRHGRGVSVHVGLLNCVTVNLENRIYRVNTRTHKKVVVDKRATY